MIKANAGHCRAPPKCFTTLLAALYVRCRNGLRFSVIVSREAGLGELLSLSRTVGLEDCDRRVGETLKRQPQCLWSC